MAFIPPMIAAAATAISTTAAAATTTAAITTPAIVGSTVEGGALAATVGTTAADLTIPAFASNAGWLGYASLGANVLGGATSALGAIKQGNAEASAAKYNAELLAHNAAQAKSNADIAGQSGSEQSFISSLRTRAAVGDLLANEAASGLDVNSGSPADVRESARTLGHLDALTIRSNAAREAYGYQVQGTDAQAQSILEKSTATSANTAGLISAGSTLLGSAGTAANNFAKYQLAGGFSA